MKNIQVIENSDNSQYAIYAVTDEEFAQIFPAEGQNVEFIEDMMRRLARVRRSNSSWRFGTGGWRSQMRPVSTERCSSAYSRRRSIIRPRMTARWSHDSVSGERGERSDGGAEAGLCL